MKLVKNENNKNKEEISLGADKRLFFKKECYRTTEFVLSKM